MDRRWGFAKDSTVALPVEGKEHVLRLLQEIPLGEAEQAAVEDGVAACEKRLLKLADVATPAGPTRRKIGPGRVQITRCQTSVRDRG
jgi:hypothetical protein